MRKTAKDSDDKGGDAADAGVGEDTLGAGDATGAGGVPLEITKKSKRKVRLPWDTSSFFSEQVPEGEGDDDDDEEEELNAASLLRLQQSDQRTKGMTKDEYLHYSECRQASFTYKKARRFRDWANFGTVTDGKPNDDIVDILGFLLYDNVQTLTEEALKFKAEEERIKSQNGPTPNTVGEGNSAAQHNHRQEEDTSQSQQQQQHPPIKRETGLFDMAEEGTSPVNTRHVREAFRRLQARPIPGRCVVRLGAYRNVHRTELKLVSHDWISVNGLLATDIC